MGRAATAPARTAPARPAPGPRPAHLPRRRPHPPRRKPAAVPRGAAVLDALLHGRAWIALVFVLLAGIVFFNVDLLRMNREIAVTAEKAQAVKLENARLRTDIARLGSSERIQRVAAQRGLVLPAPSEVRYLRSDRRADARRAAARLRQGPDADRPQPSAVQPQPSTPQPQPTAPEPAATPPQPTAIQPQPVATHPQEPATSLPQE